MKKIFPYPQLPIFASFSPTTLQGIKNISSELEYPNGRLIFLESEEATAIYIILEGEVKTYRTTPDGRQQILTRLFQGDVFNIVPLLIEQTQNQSNVEAVGQTRLLCIPKDGFFHLLETCPEFSFAMMQVLARRLQKMTAMVEDLSLHSVRARLAQFLILQAGKGKGEPKYTQDEIAQEIGTVRDVVGRLLKIFEVEGYIHREGRKVILLDRARLEAEANS
jgi:CRP/FNR family transcriptional regulator